MNKTESEIQKIIDNLKEDIDQYNELFKGLQPKIKYPWTVDNQYIEWIKNNFEYLQNDDGFYLVPDTFQKVLKSKLIER